MTGPVDMTITVDDETTALTTPGAAVDVDVLDGPSATAVAVDEQAVTVTAAPAPTVDVSTFSQPFTVVTVPGGQGPIGPPGLNAPIYGEVPAGSIDGVNAVFTTALDFQPGTASLYRNGLRGLRGYDFVESGPNEITFTTPPDADDVISVDYLIA